MSLFRSTSRDPEIEFSGEYYGYYYCKKSPKDYVLLTISDTTNKDIKLVNVYVNGSRKTGVRYNKNRISIFEIDILLNRVYWDWIWKSLD